MGNESRHVLHTVLGAGKQQGGGRRVCLPEANVLHVMFTGPSVGHCQVAGSALHTVFNPHLRSCLLILESGKGREQKREKNIDQLLPVCALTGDGAHSLGMCRGRDQESNP